MKKNKVKPAPLPAFQNHPAAKEEGAAAEPEPKPELKPSAPAPVSHDLFSGAPVLAFDNTGDAQEVAPITSSEPPPATTQTAHEQEPRTAPTCHGDDAAAALASARMARFTSAGDDGWM